MEETLRFILDQIVDHPEDIVIDNANQGDRTIFTIHVNQEDIGKVIGKKGRIIRSVRDLIKLIAAKNNLFVDVILAE